MANRSDLIHTRLTTAFSPSVLLIEDQSDHHIGHAGHNRAGESHFDVTVVSNAFTGLSRVERQKRVYAALGDLFQQGLHALALQAKTPEEYHR